MGITWAGVAAFKSSITAYGTALTRDVGDVNYKAAQLYKERALQNMDRSGDMRINRITGLSRDAFVVSRAQRGTMLGTALNAVAAVLPLVQPGQTSLAASAGYLDWPGDVEPYPIYLNYGTRLMSARPYASDAFRVAKAYWEQQLPQSLRSAAVFSGMRVF